jgi:hypothetical protein
VTEALEEDKNTYLFRGVTEALEGNKVEGVVNVAGGWAGGSTKDPKWINNAELMWKQSGERSVPALFLFFIW